MSSPQAKHELTIPNIPTPIGACVLLGHILVVSVTGENRVKLFDVDTGKYLSELAPAESGGRPFKKPSDTVAVNDGRFAGG